ncbi:hypothetical protein Zmor_027169 [Zophobas morio]|uniref:Reverse transcriptase domain-containing protein n=1 Tax=Zophobas morio TaxID=2755281 RepID=A0AA38HPV8_9CUCU|nr:hypothetical protein Zmor_027169 [Zophobas morio]
MNGSESKETVVLQINAQRKGVAMDVMWKTVQEEGVNVLVVSEPNKKRVKGLEWMTDVREDVAVRVCGRHEKGEMFGKGEGFVWIKFSEWVLYGCYISPNIDIGRYTKFLDDLGESVNTWEGEVVVAGDFNAKSPLWGSPIVNDPRGRLVEDWMAERCMVCHNCGNAPTFRRGDQKSHIDLTLSTEGVARRMKEWRVLEQENLSDHQDIVWVLGKTGECVRGDDRMKDMGWRVAEDKMERLAEVMKERVKTMDERKDLVCETKRVLEETCDRVLKKKGCMGKRKGVYWWTNEIAEKRRECLRKRREWTRCQKKRGNMEVIAEKGKEYKQKKKELKIMINGSKEKAWKKVCEEVDRNVWGEGYKIVTKWMGRGMSGTACGENEMEEARKLFPEHGPLEWTDLVVDGLVPAFTPEELQEAAGRLRKGKAPGPDKIPPEVCKIYAQECGKECLEVMNRCLEEGVVPKEWKVARLVLIEKERKEGENAKYRPICLLNGMGKLYEGMLAARLRNDVRRLGGLAETQHGFRAGRSTIDAMMDAREYARGANVGTWGTRRFCVMVTVDVRNAFNTVSWRGILERLVSMGVEPYLVNVVRSYLSDRVVQTGMGEFEMTAGVPQGSVLGPLLWNIFYDEVLRMEVPDGVKLIGYADDLAVIVIGKNEEDLRERTEEALRLVGAWMGDNGLSLAPEKSEAVLLVGRRTIRGMSVCMEGRAIETREAVRYLGVDFQRNLRVAEQVERVVRKAKLVVGALGRLLPNVGGPRASKRRVLCSVVHGILLYGAEVWIDGYRIQKYRQMLLGVQRNMLLRVCCAYRTVSGEALCVLAGVPPLDLLAEERLQEWKRRKNERVRESNSAPSVACKGEARKDLMQAWCERWRQTEKAAWTRRLIPNLTEWVGRGHGEVNHYTSQVLTGHGSFGAYLKRIGKIECSACWYCEEGVEEDVEHAIFDCHRWTREREECEVELGMRVKVDNMVGKMLESEEGWKVIERMLVTVMKAKCEYERERERRQEVRDE